MGQSLWLYFLYKNIVRVLRKNSVIISKYYFGVLAFVYNTRNVRARCCFCKIVFQSLIRLSFYIWNFYVKIFFSFQNNNSTELKWSSLLLSLLVVYSYQLSLSLSFK